jgi:hypothetical protein
MTQMGSALAAVKPNGEIDPGCYGLAAASLLSDQQGVVQSRDADPV